MLQRTLCRANGGTWRPSCARELRMSGRPILTAQKMRDAEQAAIDGGTSVEQLMERAGTVLAEAAYRFAGPIPVLLLCGPGNNGGDGYVAASQLAHRGVAVQIAAIGEPRSEAARWARFQLGGRRRNALQDATAPAPLLIDCLFGTGLRYGIEDHCFCCSFSRLRRKIRSYRSLAIIPSGVDSNGGAELSAVPAFDMTVTFGALKPAHLSLPGDASNAVA